MDQTDFKISLSNLLNNLHLSKTIIYAFETVFEKTNVIVIVKSVYGEKWSAVISSYTICCDVIIMFSLNNHCGPHIRFQRNFLFL